MTSGSVPDIGRSLQQARTRAGLSLPDAAIRVGASSYELEALESGTVSRMANRIETLRTLRRYADSLDLPGDRYVLTVLALWPDTDLPARNGDTGVVPMVSVTSSAPAGGHSPAGDYGAAFTTGVTDSSVTGVVGRINDTRQVPAFDTSQVPVVRQSAPRYLKVLVGLVVLLIIVAGVGLSLHNQVSRWIHSAKSETTHLIKSATNEPGSTSPSSKQAGDKKTAGGLPKVTTVTDPTGQGATINVAAASFGVDVIVANSPSWVQVTDSGGQAPVFSQVVPPGQSHAFTVTQSATFETGSSGAHFVIVEGTKTISTYVPAKAPFTLTVNSVG